MFTNNAFQENKNSFYYNLAYFQPSLAIYRLQSVHFHIYVWLKFWSLTVTEANIVEALKEYSS